jgi:hypothetical protein
VSAEPLVIVLCRNEYRTRKTWRYAAGFNRSLSSIDAANLYGTVIGGAGGHGVIFRMSRDAKGVWTETVLHCIWQAVNGDGPSRPRLPDACRQGQSDQADTILETASWSCLIVATSTRHDAGALCMLRFFVASDDRRMWFSEAAFRAPCVRSQQLESLPRLLKNIYCASCQQGHRCQGNERLNHHKKLGPS